MLNPFKSIKYPRVFIGASWSSKKVEPLQKIFSVGKFSLHWCTNPLAGKIFDEKYKMTVIRELFKDFDLKIEVMAFDNNTKEHVATVVEQDLTVGVFVAPIIEAIKKYDESKYFVMHSAYSKIDGGYVGVWEDAWRYKHKFNLTQIQKAEPTNNVTSIGFNEQEQKWYGWSHRALFGFGVGSTVKMGDCAFAPSNKEELAQSCAKFWEIDNPVFEYDISKFNFLKAEQIRAIEKNKEQAKIAPAEKITANTKKIIGVKISNEKSLRFEEYPTSWGRGAWEAKTLDEAKIMAKDFAGSVS